MDVTYRAGLLFVEFRREISSLGLIDGFRERCLGLPFALPPILQQFHCAGCLHLTTSASRAFYFLQRRTTPCSSRVSRPATPPISSDGECCRFSTTALNSCDASALYPGEC